MAVIKAQKIPTKEVSVSEVLARFCYHYPRYTYAEARKLPYKRVVLLLKVARSEKARDLIDLVRIASAPHIEKGRAVNKLLDEFKSRLF